MKRFRAVVILVVVSLAAVGLFSGMVYAASPTQTIQGSTNKSIYKVAQTLDISGTVNGDIYCAAQTININATVNGDVLCAGQSITINGTVRGSVRLIGQTITLAGQVTHAATIVSQDTVIENTASVGQDLSAAGRTLVVNGPIGRDINGVVRSITLNSSIGRNVDVHSNSLTLGKNVKVSGSVIYTSPKIITVNRQAIILGGVIYHLPARHNLMLPMLHFMLYILVALIVLGVVLVALFPQAIIKLNPANGSSFWWSMLVGFVAMFLLPIAISILFITIIGAPLGLLLLALWIAVSMLSLPVAAFYTGSLVASRAHPVLIVLLGAIILGLIGLIPFVGGFVLIIAYWVGSGALLRRLKSSYHKPDYKAPKSINVS